MREGEGVAAGVLENLGLSLDKIRAEAAKLPPEKLSEETGEASGKTAVTFRVTPHSSRPDVEVAGIFLNGEIVATIYPDGEKGVKIVSAHMETVHHDAEPTSVPPIPAVLIQFDPQPYSIEGGKIVKHPR